MLGRQRIGPFDVTRLAANDPTALATWLADKGFPRPDDPDRTRDRGDITGLVLIAVFAAVRPPTTTWVPMRPPWLYQFDRPFLVDDSRIRKLTGRVATGWEDGIRQTLDWYRADPKRSRYRVLPGKSH